MNPGGSVLLKTMLDVSVGYNTLYLFNHSQVIASLVFLPEVQAPGRKMFS